MNEIQVFEEHEILNTVSARDIHEQIGGNYDFSNWIKKWIDDDELIENIDYIKIESKNKSSITGQNIIDYHVVTEVAKSKILASKTETGKALRKIIIESEMKLKKAANELIEEQKKQLQLEIREKRRLAIDNNVLSNHKEESWKIAENFKSKALLFERLENMLFEYNGLTIEQYFSEVIETLIFDNNPEAEMSLSDIEQKTPRLSPTLRTKILNDMVKKGILKKIKNGYGLTFN